MRTINLCGLAMNCIVLLSNEADVTKYLFVENESHEKIQYQI